MSAGKYSFVIEQGATFDVELVYKDSEGNFVDLTNYSARMKVKPSIDSDVVYLNLSSSLQPDGTGLNMSGSLYGENYPKPPTSGSIGIFISAVTSSLLDFSEAVYDLEIESASGYVTRLLKGNITLDKEVTD